MADPRLFAAWLALVAAAGLLPVGFVLTFGIVVEAVLTDGGSTGLVVAVGLLFVAINAVPPLLSEASENLGDVVVGSFEQRLMTALNQDSGLESLEDPDLAADVALARDFDLALSGPPVSVAMGFIASGMAGWLTGIGMAAVLCTFAWWAGALLAAGWLCSNWLMRESAVWRERGSDDVRLHQREADYMFRTAVNAPAAKEVRLFALQTWVVDNFRHHRSQLAQLRIDATRMRLPPVLASVVLLLAVHILTFLVLADRYVDGQLRTSEFLTFTFAALGTSGLSFGTLNWVMSMCTQVSDALDRVEARMARSPLRDEQVLPRRVSGTYALELESVGFTYPRATAPALRSISLRVEAGSSLAIVGANGAGKTTLAKLISGLYLPTRGHVRLDGIDVTHADPAAWRREMAVIFQDFVRYEFSLKANVAPIGGTGDDVRWALELAGFDGSIDLDQQLGAGYKEGRELSGGQWQRVAIARALHRVRTGARLLILDEPTSQLDIDGERQVFDRILKASADCATILISHRFASVRHADQICVVQDGLVVELGNHDELMHVGGVYERMFTAQAERFVKNA